MDVGRLSHIAAGLARRVGLPILFALMAVAGETTMASAQPGIVIIITYSGGTIKWTIIVQPTTIDPGPGILSTHQTIDAIRHDAAWGTPTVTVTDTLGNPLIINGTPITLSPSASDTTTAQTNTRTVTSDQPHGFVWRALRSNLIPSGGQTSYAYKVVYSWPDIVPHRTHGGHFYHANTQSGINGGFIATVVPAFVAHPVPAAGSLLLIGLAVGFALLAAVTLFKRLQGESTA